ncbi:MAG: alpha/beta hydrolase [Acidimicrobiia bacterium]|nr:alpha/beta hydrolase [Acidimicrobiia bacterium]
MRRHVWLLALLAVVPCGLASCARSSTLAVYRDLEYERVADQPVRLDAYVPLDGRTHRGAVVVVHGGGWAIGDKESLAPEARAFAEAGLVAFSVDYRLGSAGRFPQALEDVRAAVRWVQDRAGRFSIDPARVGIFGTSAGGNLALMVATTGVGGAPVRHPRVAAAVSWSGPTDLRVLALVPRGRLGRSAVVTTSPALRSTGPPASRATWAVRWPRAHRGTRTRRR